MFCPKCGSKIQEGATFCPSCGATINARPLVGAKASSFSGNSQSLSSAIVASGPSTMHANGSKSTMPELGGPARRIMTNRGLLKYILFSFLTLGIYGYYFVYRMAKDMNTMCEDDDQKTGGLVAFILLNIVTFGIYGVYWWYKIANRVYLNAPRYGVAVAEKGSTFLLWYLVGLLTFGIVSLFGYHAVIKNVNSLAKAYNQAHGFC